MRAERSLTHWARGQVGREGSWEAAQSPPGHLQTVRVRDGWWSAPQGFSVSGFSGRARDSACSWGPNQALELGLGEEAEPAWIFSLDL